MPRMPSGAPSGLASTTNAEPLALDANHLNPLIPLRRFSGSRRVPSRVDPGGLVGR